MYRFCWFVDYVDYYTLLIYRFIVDYQRLSIYNIGSKFFFLFISRHLCHDFIATQNILAFNNSILAFFYGRKNIYWGYSKHKKVWFCDTLYLYLLYKHDEFQQKIFPFKLSISILTMFSLRIGIIITVAIFLHYLAGHLMEWFAAFLFSQFHKLKTFLKLIQKISWWEVIWT